MTQKSSDYTADNIIALSPREHLLKRTSLVFGRETGNEEHPFSSQKTVAIRELQDNSLDELRAEHGNYMKMHFHKDGSVTVTDSGRGVPVDTGRTAEGKPANGVYLCFAVLQSGAKFTHDSSRFSSGLNGLGSAATNLMSKAFIVDVYRNKKKYSLHFKDGDPGLFEDDANPDSKFTKTKDLKFIREEKDDRPADLKKLCPTGTTIRCWLNDKVFSSKYPVDVDDIIDRARGSAFLVPGITIEIVNELREIDGEPQHELFSFTDGLKQLVELNQTKERISPILKFSIEGSYIEPNVPVIQEDGRIVNQDLTRRVPIDVAMSWENGFDYKIESFVNTIRTRLGGVHENAFERALTTTFNDKLRSMRGVLTKKDDDPTFDDYMEGLTVVLSIQASEPQFTSQTKEELGGRELQKAVLQALTDEFKKYLNQAKNYDEIKRVGDKVIQATRNRVKARELREVRRKKAQLENSTMLPSKLVDCEITHDVNSELYILEGDSAMGAAKSARNSQYQALLPIRGKIINSHKAPIKTVLANKEVQDIIKCLDVGIGNDLNLEDLRYGRVVFAVDADPDGGAIAALLIVLFWNLFPKMIEEGRIFKLSSPLYILKSSKETFYAKDDAEKDEFLKNNKGIKVEIQRNKGLGETGADVLAYTSMDPETRSIIQININDIEEAEKILDVAMGPNVEIRREWIEANPILRVAD